MKNNFTYALPVIHSDRAIREGFFVGILNQLSWVSRDDVDAAAGCVITGGVEGGLRYIHELANLRGQTEADELKQLLQQNEF